MEMEIIDLLLEIPDDVVINNVIGINRIIQHAVEELAVPMEPIPERRNPVRNEDYFEYTIPLYTLDEFKSHFRMSRASVEIIMNRIANILPQRGVLMNMEKKVLFTIWILAKPETFLACSDRFGIAPSTGHYIYSQIVNALTMLADEYIQWPNDQQCTQIAQTFKEKSRGIPNVIGAIDGTHIFIKQPIGNAVDYYNRYQSHSLVVQAVCDCNRLFTNISVGYPGRMHDARIFRNSNLYQGLINEENPLIKSDYHIIGDAAYPLLQTVLTPYRNTGHLTHSQIRYNTRFSSIRSVVERAFGLLKGKWRRLKYLDMSDMNLANKVITAAFVLHNFVIRQEYEEDEDIYIEDEEIDDPPNLPHNERRQHLLGEVKRDEIRNALI